MSERRVILINTCSTAARAYSNAHFGQGSVATIWLDDVHCSGLEAQLLDCPAQPLGTHNCGHNEDAGVSCGTSQGTTNCTYSLGHSPSIAFRHLTANSVKMGYSAKGALCISAQLSTDAVSISLTSHYLWHAIYTASALDFDLMFIPSQDLIKMIFMVQWISLRNYAFMQWISLRKYTLMQWLSFRK